MLPEERAELIRRKELKKQSEGIATPIEPVLSESTEPLPEEPAIKPRRTRGHNK